jgi:hypothetical protein
VTNPEDLLIISTAKVGNDRYVWIAGTYTAFSSERGPEHYGYVDGLGKALGECARAKDLLDPSRQMKCASNGRGNGMRMNVPAGFAREWHRRLSEKKREEKPSHATDSARLEFVYRSYYSFGDRTTESIPHQVIKKTPKKIVIHHRAYRPGHVWKDKRTLHLSREELETQGRVWHGGDEFTLTPKEGKDLAGQHNDWLHDKSAALGLTWPCSRREITKAFRVKVKEVHPDKGGTNVEFIELRKVYEQLIKIAQ